VGFVQRTGDGAARSLEIDEHTADPEAEESGPPPCWPATASWPRVILYLTISRQTLSKTSNKTKLDTQLVAVLEQI
jgi:hypothetical protein